MDINELESIISTYKISKPKIRSDEVENKSLPFMLSTFRELIRSGVPPTQEEFISTFKCRYPDLLVYKGIVSRLKRAYLSYVREYHLGYLLRKHFKRVKYDEKLDLSGVDYVVYYRGSRFNIHAYVNTENGKHWREVKNIRHNFHGEHLDIPMDLDSGKRCGKFILYDDRYIKKLKEDMDEVIYRRRINKRENNR